MNYFLDKYKYLFNLFKEMEDNIKQNIIIIFGSSMEEKHLISFITNTYESNNDNFYINHNKIKPKIYSILKSRGFNYISTCIKRAKKNDCIDECNNLFFMNIEQSISGYYSPKPIDLSDYYNKANDEIINEITKIENYVFGKTFKQIDKIINKRVNNEDIPFKIYNKNHFLSIFLWKKDNENIGKYVRNIYLYYYEKDQDFWNIFEMEDVYKNKKMYFRDFLKYILINDKFKFKDFANNYIYFLHKEEKWLKLFNDFFSNLNNSKEEERYLILNNFFKQIKSGDSLIDKGVFFVKKLNKFKIKIDYERFIKEFEIEETNYKYGDFINRKKLIIFITHFLEINNLTNVIEKLIPDLKLISNIDFVGSNKNLKNENVRMYLDDFNFMEYVFLPYTKNNKNIALSSFEEFNPDDEFDLISTNFLLNYYSNFPNYSSRINDLFNNRKYRGKIWKFVRSTGGIVRSFDANQIIEDDLKYYEKKWKNNDFSEIFQRIKNEKDLKGYIENENEKIKIIKSKLFEIFKMENWKTKMNNISKTFLEFEETIQKSPWNEWNFFIKMVIEKYVEDNKKISILELDKFLLLHFEEKYLNGQHMEKFNNLIKLEMIEWGGFSKIENIKSTFLFNQIFDLLNINSGNIFYIFGDTFKTNGEDSPQVLYFLKIWQQIFDNSKDLPKLIEKIIDCIKNNDEKYKNNLRQLFENVFLDNSISTWKKGLYCHFDSFSPENTKFYEEGEWKFRDNEFDSLNNFLENLNYQSKNSNIILMDNFSQIILIRYWYKKLFLTKHYDGTNLLYNMIFNDKKTLIESGRQDFILFELTIIYKKFYNKDKNEFNVNINDEDLLYLWEIFMKLSNFDLKNENIEMLKSIHNSLKKKHIPKKLISEKYSQVINGFIKFTNRQKKEKNKTEEELYKFKFCLLSLTKPQLLKEIKNLKDNHFFTNNYEKIIENISSGSDDFLCKEHSS